MNGFSNKDSQDTYLQGLIQKVSVRNRRPRKAEPKARSCNFEYFSEAKGRRRKVCKKTFISLHGFGVYAFS